METVGLDKSPGYGGIFIKITENLKGVVVYIEHSVVPRNTTSVAITTA